LDFFLLFLDLVTKRGEKLRRALKRNKKNGDKWRESIKKDKVATAWTAAACSLQALKGNIDSCRTVARQQERRRIE
jgi:hypothetical protein